MYRIVLALLTVCGLALVGVLVVNLVQGGAAAQAGAEGTSGTSTECVPGWVAAWNASPLSAPAGAVGSRPGVSERSLRMLVRPSVAGSEVRLVLSNRYGNDPLDLWSVSVAKAGSGAGLADNPRPVTFDQLSTGQVPPHGVLVSDPVPLGVVPSETLAVSMYLPGHPAVVSEHPWAMQTSYISDPGDFAGSVDGGRFTHTINSWLVLEGLDVHTAKAMNAVVMMGDSITDGMGSSPDADRRLTDDLAAKLTAMGGDKQMAVLNSGIAGNQLLVDYPGQVGESAFNRLSWEVAGRSGVTDVILHAGTNDLAAGANSDAVVAGMVRFTERAHQAGLRVFLTTITPASTGRHSAPAVVAARSEVNQWIRAHGKEHADGVFDFAAAVTDVSNPNRLVYGFDAGDGVHLSDVGYRALAGAVDLSALSGSRCLA
ncbi:MAG TPA: GDSL-type esterase/lipase family protein [Pseudonocardia sp.]|nr:GDSL-type esterase/lipase family protein [Pseudonocardia sp.]